MNWDFPPSAIPLHLAGLVSLILALLFARYRDKPIIFIYFIFTISVAFWSFGEFFQRGAQSDFQRVLATSVNFTVIPLVPVLLLIFALLYTGRESIINRISLGGLIGWSIFVTLMMWTNSWHGLMFREISMDGFVRGPFFFIHSVISYLLIFISIGLMAQRFVQSSQHRRQTGIFLIGVAIPLAFNLIFVFRLVPVEGDWTPFSFVLGIVVIAFGLYVSGLMDFSSIARQAVVDSLQDVLIITDANDHIVSLNDAAKRTFNLTDRSAEGMQIEELFGPEWTKNLKLKGEDKIFGELAVKTVGNFSAYFDVQGARLRDERDTPQGHVYILRDITERKAMEDSLRMERRLAEQAAEKYRAARDEALDINRQKSELMARVSHELRMPLVSILNISELFSSGHLGLISEKQKAAVERIVANVEDLTGFVNEILDEAQLSSGQIRVNISSFNPIQMIEHVTTQLQHSARKKGLTLTFDVASNVPYTVSGDQMRMQQVLSNLVSNAIKYTDEGKIHVQLFGHEGQRWGFSVSDTGIGIPVSQQKLIFQPYRQIETTETGEYGGLGLGLAIVKRVVELLDGDIQVTSQSGQGSTFRTVFPAHIEVKEPVSA